MDWLTIIGYLNPMEWAKKVFRYFRRPKLRLYFDPQETYHTRSLVDRGGALGFFCHLMVCNEGKETANNCRARLTDVKFQDSKGEFTHHPEFVNPVDLKWAHEMDFNPKDVEVDFPRRLDLCYAVESEPAVLIFFALPLPNGIRKEFPIGIYQVKIRVDSENAGSVAQEFLVDFTKKWNQIAIKTAKEKQKRESTCSPFRLPLESYHKLNIRPEITAAIIITFGTILAALLGIWGRGCQSESAKPSMEVKDFSGSRSTQVGRDYIESQQVYVNSQTGPSLPSADDITALGRRALWSNEYLGSREAYSQLLDWKNSIKDPKTGKLLSVEIKRIEDDYRTNIIRLHIDGWPLIWVPHVDGKEGFVKPEGFLAGNVLAHLSPDNRVDERARAACILRNVRTSPDKDSIDKKEFYEKLINHMGEQESSLCVSKMAFETYKDLTGFSSDGVFDFAGAVKHWGERKDEILKINF